MGRDYNVKRFEVIDGWQGLKDVSIYDETSLGILVNNIEPHRPKTVILETDNGKCVIPVLLYKDSPVWKVPSQWFHFLYVDWLTEDEELLFIAEKLLNEKGIEIDGLDIRGLSKGNLGTEYAVIDIKDTVEETTAQLGKRLRKHLRRESRKNLSYKVPEREEERQVIDNWLKGWNENDGTDFETDRWLRLQDHWKSKGIEIFTEGIYIDNEFVGHFTLLVEGETAYAIWTVWYKDRFGDKLGFGYVAKQRQIEFCVKRGLKYLDLGSTFLSEGKERWATSLVRYHSLGKGFIKYDD